MNTVEARNLVKKYGPIEAVKGIELEVQSGEVFGMLGPNGAGKTTTVKMICGLVKKTSGVVRVFGLDIDTHLRAIQHRIGVMPQDDNLDPDISVLENLLVHAGYFKIRRSDARERAEELLDFVQLREHANAKVSAISGGMRRRLLLARALINKPDLLLLDEPTVGLDPQARLAVWAKVSALRSSGATVIVTTHYMEEAQRLCDRVAIVDHGRIVALGNPLDLIAKHLPKEVLEVRFSNGTPDLPHLPGARIERTADALYLYADDVSPYLDTFSNIRAAILRRNANLEDVFLALTGRELRE